MPDLISLVICLIIALLITAAVLGVLRAVLALPPLSGLAPYGGVIYALVVLLAILIIVSYCFGGFGYFGVPHRLR